MSKEGRVLVKKKSIKRIVAIFSSTSFKEIRPSRRVFLIPVLIGLLLVFTFPLVNADCTGGCGEEKGDGCWDCDMCCGAADWCEFCIDPPDWGYVSVTCNMGSDSWEGFCDNNCCNNHCFDTYSGTGSSSQTRIHGLSGGACAGNMPDGACSVLGCGWAGEMCECYVNNNTLYTREDVPSGNMTIKLCCNSIPYPQPNNERCGSCDNNCTENTNKTSCAYNSSDYVCCAPKGGNCSSGQCCSGLACSSTNECEGCDNDSDGFEKEIDPCNGDDCDDHNSSINPNASEECNNVDMDCDGNYYNGLDRDSCSLKCEFDGYTWDSSEGECCDETGDTWCSGSSSCLSGTWYSNHCGDGPCNCGETCHTCTADCGHCPEVELISPRDGDTNVPLSPNLVVNLTDEDDDKMNITFRNASDNSIICSNTSISDGEKVYCEWANLQSCNTYDWYVNVTDGTGTVISSTWNFTTNCGPQIDLNYPPDGSTGIDTDPTLNVTVNDPEGSRMNVSFHFSPSGDVIEEYTRVSPNTDLTASLSNLCYSSTIEWYVNATDGEVTTIIDPPWNFTVEQNYAPNIINPEPNDGASGITPGGPKLKATVEDPNGDNMNVVIRIGGEVLKNIEDVSSGSRVSAGVPSSYVEENESYTWAVEACDFYCSNNSCSTCSDRCTTQRYHFTTHEREPLRQKVLNNSNGLYDHTDNYTSLHEHYTFTFNASRSYDPETGKSDLDYYWNFGDGSMCWTNFSSSHDCSCTDPRQEINLSKVYCEPSDLLNSAVNRSNGYVDLNGDGEVDEDDCICVDADGDGALNETEIGLDRNGDSIINKSDCTYSAIEFGCGDVAPQPAGDGVVNDEDYELAYEGAYGDRNGDGENDSEDCKFQAGGKTIYSSEGSTVPIADRCRIVNHTYSHSRSTTYPVKLIVTDPQNHSTTKIKSLRVNAAVCDEEDPNACCFTLPGYNQTGRDAAKEHPCEAEQSGNCKWTFLQKDRPDGRETLRSHNCLATPSALGIIDENNSAQTGCSEINVSKPAYKLQCKQFGTSSGKYHCGLASDCWYNWWCKYSKSKNSTIHDLCMKYSPTFLSNKTKDCCRFHSADPCEHKTYTCSGSSGDLSVDCYDAEACNCTRLIKSELGIPGGDSNATIARTNDSRWSTKYLPGYSCEVWKAEASGGAVHYYETLEAAKSAWPNWSHSFVYERLGFGFRDYDCIFSDMKEKVKSSPNYTTCKFDKDRRQMDPWDYFRDWLLGAAGDIAEGAWNGMVGIAEGIADLTFEDTLWATCVTQGDCSGIGADENLDMGEEGEVCFVGKKIEETSEAEGGSPSCISGDAQRVCQVGSCNVSTEVCTCEDVNSTLCYCDNTSSGDNVLTSNCNIDKTEVSCVCEGINSSGGKEFTTFMPSNYVCDVGKDNGTVNGLDNCTIKGYNSTSTTSSNPDLENCNFAQYNTTRSIEDPCSCSYGEPLSKKEAPTDGQVCTVGHTFQGLVSTAAQFSSGTVIKEHLTNKRLRGKYGIWDQSQEKCVKCKHNLEKTTLGDSDDLYFSGSKTTYGRGLGESACGADNYCDEVPPNTYPKGKGGERSPKCQGNVLLFCNGNGEETRSSVCYSSKYANPLGCPDFDGNGKITGAELFLVANMIKNNNYEIWADANYDGELTEKDLQEARSFSEYPVPEDCAQVARCPDLNGDDVIDTSDLNTLTSSPSYGSCWPDNDYNETYDISNDGCVDNGDWRAINMSIFLGKDVADIEGCNNPVDSKIQGYNLSSCNNDIPESCHLKPIGSPCCKEFNATGACISPGICSEKCKCISTGQYQNVQIKPSWNLVSYPLDEAENASFPGTAYSLCSQIPGLSKVVAGKGGDEGVMEQNTTFSCTNLVSEDNFPISSDQSYLLKLRGINPQGITLWGTPPSSHNITLSKGWNWVGWNTIKRQEVGVSPFNSTNFVVLTVSPNCTYSLNDSEVFE